MKNRHCLVSGFTLVETLVALSILAIILTVATSTFLKVMTRSAKVKIVKAVESDGKYTLRIVERTIRNAQRVSSACSGVADSISVVDPDDQEITFTCVNEGLADGRVERTIGFSTARLTSPEVKLENCYFDCQAGGLEEPDQVTVLFILSQAGSPLRPEEEALLEFQTTVTLRNY